MSKQESKCGGVCQQHLQAMPGCTVSWDMLGDDRHFSGMLGRYPQSASLSLPADVAERLYVALGQYLADRAAVLSQGVPLREPTDEEDPVCDLKADV